MVVRKGSKDCESGTSLHVLPPHSLLRWVTDDSFDLTHTESSTSSHAHLCFKIRNRTSYT
eukprot:scaffold22607_cov123-Cylindrotheca_fusiformis.AAC.4